MSIFFFRGTREKVHPPPTHTHTHIPPLGGPHFYLLKSNGCTHEIKIFSLLSRHSIKDFMLFDGIL